jgi:thioredoxin-like negative regulator of GroEL
MSMAITVCLELVTLATSGESYAEAFKATMDKGCPLVVMVGATWCPTCQQMKRTAIPEVKRQGILQKVAFAHVDLDEEQQLGTRLIDGRPVPQILMFRKTDQGWRLGRLVGGQDAKAVEKFIAQGIEEHSKKRTSDSSPGWQPRRQKPAEARTASVRASQEGNSATTK